MRAKAQKPNIEQSTTLLTHVRELQIRLLVTAVVLVGAGTVAYCYYGQILDILRAPLNAPLYYNSVSGSFGFIMKICMVAGIAVSVPLIVYNFIMFVRPAFSDIFTRGRIFLMTAGSIIAAAAGAVFGFIFIIPGALHFFGGFQVHGLKEMISADSYLNFVINVIITFVLMFQLPLLVSVVDRIKPISPRAMWKGEKWAAIGSVIIAILVPFAMDFMTQLLIAAPIFILYNLSFLVIAFQHSYRRKLAKKAAKLEARTARRAQRAVQRPARRSAAPAPVLVTQTLAPHPQLAEVLELQARHQPVTAKAVHENTQHTKTLRRPLVAPQPVQKPVAASMAAPQPVTNPRPRVSLDGMSRVSPRMQPGNVLRQAGTIQLPQRSLNQAPSIPSLNAAADAQ